MEQTHLAQALVENAAVLLKNEGDLLPFTLGQKLAVFGWAQKEPVLSGNGSGAALDEQQTDYLCPLREAGLSLVEPLADFYDLQAMERKKNAPPEFDFSKFDQTPTCGLMYEVFGRYTPNPEEYLVPPLLLEQAAAQTDTALWIIGRKSGGEECDRHLENDYFLSEGEQTLLAQLCTHFANVAVVLNINGAMDLAWVQEYPCIKSLLFLGIPGEGGPQALASMLCGKVSPSGKLGFTVARKYEDYPAWKDFSWKKADPEAILTYADYGLTPPTSKTKFSHCPVTAYREDIYAGYRYFDSFGVKPMFPFGFGLSYTTFSFSCHRAKKTQAGLSVTVDVQNTGDFPGREVVQLYICPDSTVSAQPVKMLKAFTKTPLLDPKQTAQCTLTIPYRELAAYQENSAAWVIEAGFYLLHLSTNGDEGMLAGVVRVEREILVEQTVNRLSMPEETRRRLCLYKRPASPQLILPADCPVLTITADDVPCWQVSVSKPIDCTRFSDHQLAALCVGYGPGIPFSAFLEVPVPNTILDEAGHPVTVNDHPSGVNGYVSPAIPEKGIHSVFYKDGPAGIGRTAWPSEMLLACSFDKPLLYAFGNALGQECELEQVNVWLGPALNLNRHPLGGRSFEYFSEDPFLTGACATAVIRGVQENHPVLACAKHFVANEQETYRRGCAREENGLPVFDAVDSLVTERALRELYLKPFEMAVKHGALHCIMTSFNKINGTFAGGSKDLCTHILREEWGFDGAVVTDWGDMDIVVDGADAVAAGNDVIMPGGPPVIDQILRGLAQGRVTRQQLQTAVGHLLVMLQRRIEGGTVDIFADPG